MTHEHFIEKCKDCDKIISQCRCISKDKEIKYSICEKCIKIKANNWVNVMARKCPMPRPTPRKRPKQ